MCSCNILIMSHALLATAILLLIVLFYYISPDNTYFQDTYNGTIYFMRYMFEIFCTFIVGVVIGYFICLPYTVMNEYYRQRNARVQLNLPGIDVAASGDHEELLAFPEILADQGEVSGDLDVVYRTRRQRMISTLLREREYVINTVGVIQYGDVRDALSLLGSTNQDFFTPSPSPEFLTPPPSPRSLKFFTPIPSPRSQVPQNQKIDQNLSNPEEAKEQKTTKSTSLLLCDDYEAETDVENNHEMRIQDLSDSISIKLQQFPRGLTKPCLSQSAMFVETFIRLMDIPYTVVFDCLDTTGPWITVNGMSEKVCGGSDCIKALKEYFPKITYHFAVRGDEKIAACSIQLILDHLSLCLRAWRWIIEDAEELRLCQPGWNQICRDFKKLSQSVHDNLGRNGFSKKSYKDLSFEIMEDFQSLSLNLGMKPFILGDTPSEIDCYAFSILCQVMWGHESILREQLRGFTNLREYCARTRERLWPDWNEQLGSDFITMNDKMQCSFDTDTENHEENFLLPDTTNSTPFPDQYYQLVPSLNDCDSLVTDSLESSLACNHLSEECVIFCTRCKVSRTQLAEEPVLPDVHAEYFDDELSDMQNISYSSHQCKK